ncbi:protein phosphatase 2C [Tieghemostelium lacteum]|uniref:Protein phosphatase 2C n=1 Tax=Tieghemostelium lacteum TaxID=361077 RepID=A0A151ZAH3_TIELA|nr:protein phosphatase 2C [Tieghemostelium lacteum]|eukprot:KYQ90939.1 protein phosphatase 2C [Tieghemostelium lacteum]
MMVPSLSTSISSPSFFKDRDESEDDQDQGEEEEEEEELQNTNEQQQPTDVQNEQQNTFNLEGLDGLNYDTNSLLTSLNQFSSENPDDGVDQTDKENLLNLLNNSNVNGLLAELDQHANIKTSSGSKATSKSTSRNSSVKSGKNKNNPLKGSGSSPKVRSMRIYRTFPYRGSLPAPIFEILNSLEISTSDIPLLQQQQHNSQPDESLSSNISEQQKPKPCSTNGIRHSRQYKGLSLLFENEKMENLILPNKDISQSKNENPTLDSSFFEPPVTSNNNATTNEESLGISNINVTELMQSLDATSGSQLEEQKLFNTSLDDLCNLNANLSDLVVEGISYDQLNEDLNANTQSDIHDLQDLLPTQITTPTSSSSVPSSPSLPSSIHGLSPSSLESPVLSANQRVKDIDATGQKKKLLSRTITFSDPSSILNFFGGNDGSVCEPLPNPQTQQQPTNNDPNNNNNNISQPLSPKSSNSKVSLSQLFPKLSFNDKSPTLSPSKFYYPLLQPQSSTSLIRGFSAKADINKKGLLRAKKVIDMEDIYHHEYPFGGADSQMALFAIFDGHSGKNAAVAAKEILGEVLLKYIQAAQKENGGRSLTDMRGVFLGTFKEIDAKLSKFEYEGSTATVVLIWRAGEQRFMQAANVGDSTAFLSYAGETLLLTKDHRVTDPEEIARIKSEGVEMAKGQTRINGLMVSRALGDHFIKHNNCGLTSEPYISPPINLTPFHTHLIVASDGLWDVISGHRAMEMIKHEQNEEKMANNLLQCALNSIKSKDNISIIVITL